MIRDAKAGLFDLIITKKISRFSRSTLDSIKYTQELLDLHIAGAITTPEFKERNDSLNNLLKEQESQLAAIHQEQAKAGTQELDIDAIRKELDVQLSFTEEINSALVATILDKIIVKKESIKEAIHLDIYLKLGQKYEAVYSPHIVLIGINPPIWFIAGRQDVYRLKFPASFPGSGLPRQEISLSAARYVLLFFPHLP